MKKEILCQRPKRALFISTEIIDKTNDLDAMCVNALSGLFSFLQ